MLDPLAPLCRCGFGLSVEVWATSDVVTVVNQKSTQSQNPQISSDRQKLTVSVVRVDFYECSPIRSRVGPDGREPGFG